MYKLRRLFQLCLLAIVSLVCACADQSQETGADESSQPQAQALIKGKVFYRERIALPKNAELKISLEDVSRMDVASLKMAEVVIRDLAAPPYEFELPYDASQIKPRMSYALQLRIEADGRLLFINTDHISPFDGAADQPLEILVSQVKSSKKSSTQLEKSAQPKPAAKVLNTYWQLQSLNEQFVKIVDDKRREIHLVLGLEEMQAYGNSGCNTFRGQYQLDPDTRGLSFSALASTRKACMQGMDLEQEFLQSLESSRSYQIEGDTLSLHDSEGRVVITFVAVYLR